MTNIQRVNGRAGKSLRHDCSFMCMMICTSPAAFPTCRLRAVEGHCTAIGVLLVKMPSSIHDLIRDLGVGTSTSSIFELGIDDVRAGTGSLQQLPKPKLLDLAEAAHRNTTVTQLHFAPDEDLENGFLPVAHILSQDLSQVAALQLTFGSGYGIDCRGKWHRTIGSCTLDLVAVAGFLRRCLGGITRLTSLTVRIPHNTTTTHVDTTLLFDWSVFSHLKGLRSLIFHCGGKSATTMLSVVLRALSTHEHLERLTLRGFDLRDYGTVPSDAKLVKEFLERRSLDTLYLEKLSFSLEISWQFFALGLERSSVKHLHLSYHGSSVASSLIMTAIATCTELRTLHLEPQRSCFLFGRPPPPLVCCETILRQNAHMTRLTLSNYEISDDEAQRISSELVRSGCVLEFLDLEGCRLSHRSMGALLASLTAHTCIRDMRLCRRTATSYTYVGDSRIASRRRNKRTLDHVEKALRGLVDTPLRSLRVFDADFQSSFDRERSRAVGMCLFGNYYLETIEIQYLDDTCRELLDSLGRLNAAGRRYLKSCRSRKAGVELLGKVSDNVTDVFMHLCENPSLCVF